MSYELLRIVISFSIANFPTDTDAVFAPWGGPDPTAVRV